MKQLKVDSVVKYFGTRKVLSDVHLHCQSGEIVGLLGRNGSGKSTLLKIIFGILPAENAYVNLNGDVLTNRFKRSQKMAFLYQDTFVPQEVKVRTLLKLFHAENLKTHPLVDKVLNQTFGQLSGGEARYLEILFVLNCKAPYVILDEPFNGLSPILKEEIKNEIKVASATKGIIITDHDYRNVLEITNRNYMMIQGNIKTITDLGQLQIYGYIP